MYIWHTNKLVEDFQNDNVSEKEKFKYILFFGILASIYINALFITAIIAPTPPEYLNLNIIYLILDPIIIVIGTYYCYISNKNADNKDFVTRFICITIPIYIKLFIFFIPIIIFFGIIIMADKDFYQFINFFLHYSIEIVYYYILGNKFKLFTIKNKVQTIAGENI